MNKLAFVSISLLFSLVYLTSWNNIKTNKSLIEIKGQLSLDQDSIFGVRVSLSKIELGDKEIAQNAISTDSGKDGSFKVRLIEESTTAFDQLNEAFPGIYKKTAKLVKGELEEEDGPTCMIYLNCYHRKTGDIIASVKVKKDMVTSHEAEFIGDKAFFIDLGKIELSDFE